MPDGNLRASAYGFDSTPSVIFDGTQSHVGGAASGSMYNTYFPIVSNRLASASPLSITASYVLLDGQVTVTADIGVDLATSGANREVKFFVAQADLHAHLNMVVGILPAEPFSLTTPGQSVTVQRTFAMDAAWNQPELTIIVLVQDSGTKEIYQAGQAFPDYAGTVVIDCDPDGVEAAWTASGPGFDLSGNGDHTADVFAVGAYTVTWQDIPYWTSPGAPQVQTLIQDETITFTGSYADGPFVALTSGPVGDVDADAAVSLIDLDNDGDLDLHMTGDNGGDVLLRNDGSSVFSNLGSSALAEADAVRDAAWADITGDGNLDVYLTRYNLADQLYIGDGAGGFVLASTFPDGDAGPGNGAAWIDYNLDGVMDLSLVRDGATNVLLAGQGEIAPGFFFFSPENGAFENDGPGGTIVWGDGDLDGRPDPFIVNQFGRDVLLQNLDIGFIDLTDSQGMGDLGNGKGAAWGDLDNDGDLDLYVANDGQADRLYLCTGPLQYTQIPGPNLADMGHGRGVVWADLDNDTRLDLYVARHDEPDLFLLGDGLGGFTRVPVGVDEATWGGNAVACGDLNKDGHLDLLVTREGAANVLFENALATGRHWLRLHLTGAGNNTRAVGARVVVTTGSVAQTRYLSPSSGYRSCSAIDPHFGLGDATVVDRIDIFWPSGAHQVVGPQTVDKVIPISEGVDPPSAVDDADLPAATVLRGAYPNPFNPSTTIGFALRAAARARVAVFTIEGRHVCTLVDRNLDAGPHSVVWNGVDGNDRPVASGTYLFRLRTDDGFDASGRMVLVK